MALLQMTATALVFLSILSLGEAGSQSLQQFEAPANHVVTKATTTHQNFNNKNGGECRPRDISITQGQVSGTGIPMWQVQIINLCTHPRCVISQVIVQCGAFHSATLVNPHIFRRLNDKDGICIVVDGKKIGNGQTVAFRYGDSFKQQLTLKSAKVTCW